MKAFGLLIGISFLVVAAYCITDTVITGIPHQVSFYGSMIVASIWLSKI